MKNKRSNAIKSLFVGLIVGVAIQYIVEFVIKFIKIRHLKEASAVSYPWQAYYTAGIAGGINGFLQVFIPSFLYQFSAVFVIVAVYNSLLIFSTEDELKSNIKSNNDFIFGVIRDIFLISFILFIVQKLIPNSNAKKEERDIFSLIGTSIATSIFISIPFSLSQDTLNKIFNVTSSLNVSITDE